MSAHIEIGTEVVYPVSIHGRLLGQFSRTELLDLINEAYRVLHLEPNYIGPERIIQEVCTRFGLTRHELHSKSRTARIAFPRQVCMALIYVTGRMSLTDVGAMFPTNGIPKNHGTVIHARQLYQARRLQDTKEGRVIRAIEAALTEQVELLNKPQEPRHTPNALP